MSDVEDEFAGLPDEEEEFVDDAAEEGGSGEGEEEGDGDGAGDGEGEGSASADSSEEEEDGENEYEADGFVVDEDVAEDEGDEGEEEEIGKRKRKKRRREKNFALDEEDYMLLEDNQVRVKRPAERKRLKRRGEDSREPGKEKASGAKQLQEALFGTGDLEDELEELDGRQADEGAGEEAADRNRNRYDDFGEISDEMDDFIVDGEDGDRRRARRKRDARMAEAAGLSTQAVQAANRLFGNFGELLDLHQSNRLYGRPGAEEEEDEEIEEEPEEELGPDDEEELERRRIEREERKEERRRQKLLSQVDPELVDSHFLRPADQTIRQMDIPERLQLLGKSVLESVPEDARRLLLDEASRWVTDHLFGSQSTESKVREIVEDGVMEVTGECNLPRGHSAPGQEHLWPAWALEEVDMDLDLRNNRALLVRREKRYRDYMHLSSEQRRAQGKRIIEQWRNDNEEQAKLRESVRKVLEHCFEKHEEVPLQAMFRKENCGELLALRDSDMPETTGNERKQLSEPDARFPRGTIQPKHRCIRRWDVLWAVFNMGVRFMELYKRRMKRIDAYNRIYDRVNTEEERDAIAACHEMLTAKMHTAHGMDDIDAKFKRIIDISGHLADLTLENGDHGAPAGGGKGTKRPARPNAVRRYMKLGLGPVAREVALGMDHFRDNIEKKELVNMPEDPDMPPKEWARQRLIQLGFEDAEAGVGGLANPERFLEAIKAIVVGELVAEPCLRQVVRSELYQHAVLSTAPTPAGEDTLDPFHPYGITKHLRQKQVSSLEGKDMWLRIQAAEKQGLITVKIEWPEEHMASLLGDVGEMFISDNVAEVAAEWNNWRRAILQEAVKDKLLPVMLSELKSRLTGNAIDTVLGHVQDRFWHFVSQPPVRLMEVPDDQDQDPIPMECPRFMTVVWGANMNGDGPTTIVQLDGFGNLKDLLTAAQLSGNVPRTVNSGTREAPVFDPGQDPKKSRDSLKLRDKILEHKPNAILVATSSPQSKQIYLDIEKIYQYTESDARFKDELLPHLENKRVDVMWMDDQIAGLWASSEAAKAEFPDYSFAVRKAVGLGRYALDPLAVIAVLLGRRKEVLSLRMHELQDKLPKDALATRLEQTLITAVAQVGVDINAVAANPWRQAPLQYVPGLGPRKAKALLNSVAANDNHVKTRVDLLKPGEKDDTPFGAAPATDLQQLGTEVFKNAAPFLRVRRGEVPALQNEEEFDALDDTRIHPEDEPLLQVILEETFPELTESGAGVDVRTAIEAPQSLQQLDLWSVADANHHLYKLPTLVDMLHELLAPYGELRLENSTPDEETAFFLRHGETRESLKEGKLVEAKVVWVGETEVKVVIQNNGMEAIIPQALVSSNNPAPNLSQLFKPQSVITARITNFEENMYEEGKRRVTLYLTTASNALNDSEKWEYKYCREVDHAYHPPDKQQEQQQKAKQQQQEGSRRPRIPALRRPIEHPMWRNQRTTEVAAQLQNAPPGTALFHPSSNRPVAEQLKQITLSVKLANLATGPLIQHIEVLEPKDKPPKQPRLMTPLRIRMDGKSKVDSECYESYEDLDEIIARFVEPHVEKVAELESHRKCVNGDQQSVNNHLRQEAIKQPQGSTAGVYCVALDSHRPGSGYIAYCGGIASNVHREYFTIQPNGYYFRQRVLPSVEHVISVFKRDPNYRKNLELKKKADLAAQQGYAGAPVDQYGLQQYGPGAPPGGYVPGPGAYGAPAGGYGAPAGGAAAAAAGGYGGGGYGPGGFGQQQPRPGYQGPPPGYGQQQQQVGYGGGGGFGAPGYQQQGYQPPGGYGYQGR